MRLMPPAKAVRGIIRPRLCRCVLSVCAMALVAASCTSTGDRSAEQVTSDRNAPSERFLDLDASSFTPYSCGVRVDGSLVCWGFNDGGQSEPPTGTFTSVSVGHQHACAIDSEQRIRCWGTSPVYRVGVTAPGEPPSGSFTAVSVGDGIACALRTERTVACWWYDGGGTYGDEFDSPSGTFTAIAAAAASACGVRTNQTVECWGVDWRVATQAPEGVFTDLYAESSWVCAVRLNGEVVCWGLEPEGGTAVPTGAYRSVSLGPEHGCAVRIDSGADCWGFNDVGQLDAPEANFNRLALTHMQSCGLLDDGTAMCWGFDFDSLLVPPEGTFKEVSANAALFSCALRTDDSLACWGADVQGWLDAPSGAFSDLRTDGSHSCAKRIGGQFECWGINAEYVRTPDRPCVEPPDRARRCLGDGEWEEDPWPVPESLQERFSHVAVNTIGWCAWGNDQQVECWEHGPNWGPESYFGEPADWEPSGRFVSVTNSDYVFCGVRVDGEVDCWGWLSENSLDIPDGPFVSVSTGWWHACGLRDDGTLACWWTRFKPRPDYVKWESTS